MPDAELSKAALYVEHFVNPPTQRIERAMLFAFQSLMPTCSIVTDLAAAENAAIHSMGPREIFSYGLDKAAALLERHDCEFAAAIVPSCFQFMNGQEYWGQLPTVVVPLRNAHKQEWVYVHLLAERIPLFQLQLLAQTTDIVLSERGTKDGERTSALRAAALLEPIVCGLRNVLVGPATLQA